MPRLKNPSHRLSLESGVNNPFNHSGLKPLNLSNQPSVQSSTSLEPPHLFNLSSVQCGLNSFYQPSLRPQASFPPSNGGISRASTPP